jgi:hypothetical protein
VDRRVALKRLGLAASVAYLTPALVTLKSKSASAKKSKSSKSSKSSKTKSKPSRS